MSTCIFVGGPLHGRLLTVPNGWRTYTAIEYPGAGWASVYVPMVVYHRVADFVFVREGLESCSEAVEIAGLVAGVGR